MAVPLHDLQTELDVAKGLDTQQVKENNPSVNEWPWISPPRLSECPSDLTAGGGGGVSGLAGELVDERRQVLEEGQGSRRDQEKGGGAGPSLVSRFGLAVRR